MRRVLLALAAGVLPLFGCADRTSVPSAPELRASSVLLAADVPTTTSGMLPLVSLPAPTATRHASKWIRADQGGSVSLRGYRVDIPPGALPRDTLVTIDLPSGGLLGGHLVAEFGPHGVAFHQPVTLTFPLENVALGGAAVEVKRWENGAWQPLGGVVSPDGASLSSSTPHFSYYGGGFMVGGGRQ